MPSLSTADGKDEEVDEDDEYPTVLDEVDIHDPELLMVTRSFFKDQEQKFIVTNNTNIKPEVEYESTTTSQ